MRTTIEALAAHKQCETSKLLLAEETAIRLYAYTRVLRRGRQHGIDTFRVDKPIIK